MTVADTAVVLPGSNPLVAAPRRALAVVIGAGGGLGAALVSALTPGALAVPGALGTFQSVLSLGRSTEPAIDFTDEDSLRQAAAWVAARCAAEQADLGCLLVASGFLHGPEGQPERSWSHLNAAYLSRVFLVNTIGPALVMKHFLPLLPKQGRCMASFVSAKVGSIGDNALGGWYGYRASKAALNQLVKTASIELGRRNPQAICVALHPGTVDTALSQPFAKTGLQVRPAAQAAQEIVQALASLTPAHTGALVDYRGQTLPW